MATPPKHRKTTSSTERPMTRSTSQYFLIGKSCASILGSKLPTTRHVQQ